MVNPRLRTICLLLALAYCHVAAPGPETKPIFRFLWVGRSDTLYLGVRYRPLPYADRVDDSTYELRHGNYSGAERIRILVDGEGRVTTVEFQYATRTSFDSLRNSYAADLGTPTRADSSARERVAAWSDGATVFELIEGIAASGVRVSSRMRDLRRGRH
jgi:hypothetical protein